MYLGTRWYLSSPWSNFISKNSTTSEVTLTGTTGNINKALETLRYTSGAFVNSTDGLTVQIFKAFSLAEPESADQFLPAPYQPEAPEKYLATEASRLVFVQNYRPLLQWCATPRSPRDLDNFSRRGSV